MSEAHRGGKGRKEDDDVEYKPKVVTEEAMPEAASGHREGKIKHKSEKDGKTRCFFITKGNTSKKESRPEKNMRILDETIEMDAMGHIMEIEINSTETKSTITLEEEARLPAVTGTMKTNETKTTSHLEILAGIKTEITRNTMREIATEKQGEERIAIKTTIKKTDGKPTGIKNILHIREKIEKETIIDEEAKIITTNTMNKIMTSTIKLILPIEKKEESVILNQVIEKRDSMKEGDMKKSHDLMAKSVSMGTKNQFLKEGEKAFIMKVEVHD